MGENKNIQLDDEMMMQATGGTVKLVPYGYICDGTVTSDKSWQGTANGSRYTGYNVKGDVGKTYGCVWREDEPPKSGTRVHITHLDKGEFLGCYQADRI